MLDFYKLILSKVSFDKELLLKELKKSTRVLSSTELVDLQIWCYQNLSKLHKRELDLVFVRNK